MAINKYIISNKVSIVRKIIWVTFKISITVVVKMIIKIAIKNNVIKIYDMRNIKDTRR